MSQTGQRPSPLAIGVDLGGTWLRLAALRDGRPGALLLAGTGSIVLGRDARGRLVRAGGLGPLIGDEGSAFWLGREWLRRAPEAAATAPQVGRPPHALPPVAAPGP